MSSSLLAMRPETRLLVMGNQVCSAEPLAEFRAGLVEGRSCRDGELSARSRHTLKAEAEHEGGMLSGAGIGHK